MTPYFQDETTTIYLADNREALPLLPAGSVDMVFTSPPYNLGVSSGGGIKGAGGKGLWTGRPALAHGYGKHADAMPFDEYVAWQKDTLRECWRLITPSGAVYYNHKPRVQNGVLQTPLDLNPGLPVRQIVIWNRANGMNFSDSYYLPVHEWVVIFAKPDFRLVRGGSSSKDVWEIPPDADNPHPAPFPLELPKRAIETTTAETILDPFMGSGTVGVACAILGRKFIGIELEEKYCDLAVARIKRAKGIACDIPRLGGRQIETPLFA